jgi:hypothetical protein
LVELKFRGRGEGRIQSAQPGDSELVESPGQRKNFDFGQNIRLTVAFGLTCSGAGGGRRCGCAGDSEPSTVSTANTSSASTSGEKDLQFVERQLRQVDALLLGRRTARADRFVRIAERQARLTR